ncbi:glycosyltransferase family 1 protein [Granulicella mallensis]|jgi:glycosyltransferase involved in cell wall biosynthesis|uniref:Glycosyltransferase involved in cell wall biosynthesis n=1 Tax=Granulicella mallensis TaxID=940614 RepID=A0A7W7ZUE9_9BACT|nr:glycosyltransferase family 1 protein [Granulicella mallensis]MBB5066367.1 glycosyltransferase involved in cell wall biosynthesis [Granulicella mallensis]
MKVLIAAVIASEHISGVSRHAVNMVRCQLTRSEISEIHLVVGSWQYDAFRSMLPLADRRLKIHQVEVRRKAFNLNRWYYNELPGLANQFAVDIVHLSCPMVLKRSAFGCKVAVTLHDLYPYDFPDNFGFLKMMFNRILLKKCLHEVDAVACVSESTLRRLDMHMPDVARLKAATIYNCVDPGPAMASQSPIPGWNDEPFFLCVAQHRRSKNIVLGMQVFQQLLQHGDIRPNTRLVIIGIEGPETAFIRRFIYDNDLGRHVVLLHGIEDAEMEWCYAHCELLLALSSIEGFGLPVVEAMLHHCRVVCSDIPAFREVGGAYCHYASLQPYPEAAFIAAVRNALKDVQFRVGSAERFSSSRIVEAYLQLYTHLLHGTSVVENHNHLVPSLERGRS